MGQTGVASLTRGEAPLRALRTIACFVVFIPQCSYICILVYYTRYNFNVPNHLKQIGQTPVLGYQQPFEVAQPGALNRSDERGESGGERGNEGFCSAVPAMLDADTGYNGLHGDVFNL